MRGRVPTSQEAFPSYRILGRAGDGTYGTVWRAMHRASGALVAVKQFRAPFTSWAAAVALREVRALRALRARPDAAGRVVCLREVVREGETLFLVFEHMVRFFETRKKERKKEKKKRDPSPRPRPLHTLPSPPLLPVFCCPHNRTVTCISTSSPARSRGGASPPPTWPGGAAPSWPAWPPSTARG